LNDPVIPTQEGLFCPAGGFHIDPWSPVERAVVTHAHADHAAAGCRSYLASPPTASLLRRRLGDISIQPLDFGESLEIGDVCVSLHPAGHILGSAQVRIEPASGGPVWVVTGDFKTRFDETCEVFEPLQAGGLILESTFGLPIYRWPDEAEVFADINAWWRANQSEGRTTVLLAYSLGKAQRVLAGLDPAIGPIGAHGAVMTMTEIYREHGVPLPDATHANSETAGELKGRGVIVAPPSAADSSWLKRFHGRGGARTAFVSGWMAVRGRRRWRAADRGFVVSDHADWPGLLETVEASGAARIGVTHGYAEPLAHYLREQGRDAFALPTRYSGEGGDSTDAAAPAGGEEEDAG